MKGSIAELRAAVERELALEALSGPVHLLPAATTRLVVAHLGPGARTHRVVLDLMPAIIHVVRDDQELFGANVHFIRGRYRGWRTLSCWDFVVAVLEGAIRDAGGEP